MNLGMTWAAPAMALVLARLAAAQDPVATDGDKYRVLLENACVRVLAYHDQPGARTQLHAHPPFVLYALAPFERKLTIGDGATIPRSFAAGDVLYSPAQRHVGENVGATPTRALIVELKTADASVDCPTMRGVARDEARR